MFGPVLQADNNLHHAFFSLGFRIGLKEEFRVIPLNAMAGIYDQHNPNISNSINEQNRQTFSYLVTDSG
jgi:hypothetical protein